MNNDASNLALLFLVVAYYLPLPLVLWVLFTKAKRAGWLAVVPLYNYYVMGQIAKNPKLGSWTALLLVVTGIILVFQLIPNNYVLFSLLVVSTGLVLSLYASFFKHFDKSYKKWLLVPIVPVLGLYFLKNVKKYKAR